MLFKTSLIKVILLEAPYIWIILKLRMLLGNLGSRFIWLQFHAIRREIPERGN